MLSERLPHLHLESTADGNLFVYQASLPSPTSKMEPHHALPAPSLQLPAADLYQMACRRESPSESFVSRLLGVHFGQAPSPSASRLNVSHLTCYFHQLERRLAWFARQLPEFQALTPADQDTLLMTNTPLFLHLHLGGYVHAGHGWRQIRALLGGSASMPAVLSKLARHRSLLTVTLNYFSAQLGGLFSDRLWTDMYEMMALQLGPMFDHVAVLDDAGVMAALSSCILFFRQDDASAADRLDPILDDPKKVSRTFERKLHELQDLLSKCKKQQRQPFNRNQLCRGLRSLRSLGHFYAAHANLGGGPYAMPPADAGDFDEHDKGDDFLWLRAQLQQFETCCSDVNVGSDLLVELGLFYSLGLSVPTTEGAVAEVLRKRLQLAWKTFFDGEDAKDKKRNVERAVKSLLALLRMGGDDGAEQLRLVLGAADQEVWRDWFQGYREGVFKKNVLSSSDRDSSCQQHSNTPGNVSLLSSLLHFLPLRELFTLFSLLLLCQSEHSDSLKRWQDKFLHQLGQLFLRLHGNVQGMTIFMQFMALATE